MSAPQLTPRRIFLFALIPAVVLGARLARAEVAHVTSADGDAWKIVIEPARQLIPVDTEDATAEPSDIPAPPLALAQLSAPAPEGDDSGIAIEPNPITNAAEEGARRYRTVHNSIPFSRSAFIVNPGYRHDATMELLLGQLRPASVNQVQQSGCQGCQAGQGVAPVSAMAYPNSFGYLWNSYAYPWAQFQFWQYRAPAFQYFLPYGIAPPLLNF